MKIIQTFKNFMSMDSYIEGVEVECADCGEEIKIQESTEVAMDILYNEGWGMDGEGLAICPECVEERHYNQLTDKEKQREKQTFEVNSKKWRE